MQKQQRCEWKVECSRTQSTKQVKVIARKIEREVCNENLKKNTKNSMKISCKLIKVTDNTGAFMQTTETFRQDVLFHSQVII